MDTVFLYADGDPDQSQHLMGSKLDQDPIPSFLHKVPTGSICVILLTNRHTDWY